MRIDDASLARLSARVGRRLLDRQFTVAAAESCTGGFISKVLTDIAGSSAWFTQGFVTYGNDAKISLLGVPAATLIRHGAVSEAAARAMALGAIWRASTDMAVAVTGIAGPGGAVPGKPVGTVWLAWALRQGRTARVVVEHKRFRGDRDAVRRKSVRAALLGLMR